MNKPGCKLIGEDGNVFNVISLVQKSLNKARQKEKAKEFVKRAFASNSYEEVLIPVEEYVEVE